MQKTLFLLFILLISLGTKAQENCEPIMECRVIAPSGMRMRSEPSLKSSVVTAVPQDSILKACKETFGEMRYEKISGYWRRVSYNGKKGYMFDGFLEVLSIENPFEAKPGTDTISTADSSIQENIIEKEVTVPSPPKEKKAEYSLLTEAYNYCGDVRNIDPGLLWYGIYPADEENGGSNYRVKQVEVDVVLSKQKVGQQMEFDIQTAEEERSIFLIGLNQPLALTNMESIPDNSNELRMSGRKIFPGQEKVIGMTEKPITLSATGSVEKGGPCPDLKNYKLLLRGEKYFLQVEQDITGELSGSGRCGMPEIYWYGDLNNDHVPEIIFVSVYDEKNQFTLFVSDPAQDNILVKKEAEWIVDKCY